MERIIRVTKGILVGMLVDLFGSLVISIMLGLCLAAYLNLQGVESGQMTAVMSEMALTPLWLFLSVSLGASISVVAGFIAANQIQYNYSHALGLMGTSLALISFTSTVDILGTRTSTLFALITLVSVLAGSWLYGWATK